MVLFIQLPSWHILWVSWEREETLAMSRAGGRASRRKGQLVPGPRGRGAGSVLRRTEAGRGGAGPGAGAEDFACLGIFSAASAG